MNMCRKQGVQFLVYGIPPASRQGNKYNYTFYASAETRVEINKKFNDKLRSLCLANGWGYINIYSETVDSSGHILDKYSEDETHLNKKVTPLVWSYLTRNKYI